MKRTIITIGAVIVIAAGAVFALIHSGIETVIVNPEFENSNTDYFSVYRIERADTATVMYADVYNLPDNWVRFSSDIKLKDSKGKTYKLLKCNGFELDKEVFMPASGTMSFALYFEPVDKSEKTVDIIDMDGPEETITGFKLYKVKHNEPVQCVLKGEVVNRPQSSRIVLLKDGEDFRTAKVIYIPIRDGKFEYTLYTGFEEAYQLIFYDEILRGSWYTVDFIAESGTCYFTLNNENEWKNNSVKGGKCTETYFSIIDSLRKEMNLHYRALNTKWEKLEAEKNIIPLKRTNCGNKYTSCPTTTPNELLCSTNSTN
jgi:hypothetical protein